MNYWDSATIFIGGVATLAIYSFLIRENPFYRLFEHLFIGIAAGFLPVLTVKNTLWPQVFEPMLGFDVFMYPDGTLSKHTEPAIFLYFIPMAFGLLYYFIYSTRHSWLAKIAIGISLGYSGGLAFKGFFAEMMPQLVSSFKPLLVLYEGQVAVWESLQNTFFLFTLLAVMYYFFFTFRRAGKHTGPVSYAGRWLMMVCFGAFFGSTVMARMALLVERVQFLLHDWWQEIWRYIS